VGKQLSPDVGRWLVWCQACDGEQFGTEGNSQGQTH